MSGRNERRSNSSGMQWLLDQGRVKRKPPVQDVKTREVAPANIPPAKCNTCGSAAVYYYDGIQALCRNCFDDTMHDVLITRVMEDDDAMHGIAHPDKEAQLKRDSSIKELTVEAKRNGIS